MNAECPHRVHVAEPWFSLIKSGRKTVEGRIKKPPLSTFRVGDGVEFYSSLSDKVYARITNIVHYPTFMEYLKCEGIECCLPGVSSLEDGVGVYYGFYTKQQELEHGVLAIHILVQ